ncbi:MAG TPA: hypothetical protein VHQ22_22605 [Terriglobales bacterium]|jgi:hypothetical protein|nr:hypothetical protein [Terriglobales bacterium]
MRVLLVFAIAMSVACLAQTDSRVPTEVKFKSGYINPVRKPANFTSAMLWGIAIADTRVPGFQKSQVEIAETRLSCRVDGKDVILNDDRGNVRGGLYRRYPWFGTDVHDVLPVAYSNGRRAVILNVGERTDRVWHFWAASDRVTIPHGHFEGCSVKVRARISSGALLQIGMDYWRDSTAGYGTGDNNHEAGASDWYFPAAEWRYAIFTDIPLVK